MTFIRTLGILAAAIALGPAAWPASAADVTVWNYDVLGNPLRMTSPGPLAPMTITAARTARFSGPSRSPRPSPSPASSAKMGAPALDGAAIPAAQVAVRYAWPGRAAANCPSAWISCFEAPARHGRGRQGPRGCRRVVTVNVPADAKPGLYRGELTVRGRRRPGRKSRRDERRRLARARPQDQRTWIEMGQVPDTTC